MTRGKALLAGVFFPLLLVAVVYLLVLPHHGSAGHLVRAEMQDPALLTKGDEVRIKGTEIGSVRDMKITDHGTVMVTLALDKGTPAMASDASASVQATDLLGDVYVALQPGTSGRPLVGPIRTSRTFSATRVQDALNVFDLPTRVALQTVFVELGRALQARGVDLNEAVLQLAPALRATDRISRQLGGQDAGLQRLVSSTHRLTAELAPRAADIERLIQGFDRAFSVTSEHAQDLDRGLAGLPAMLAQTRQALVSLDRSARAGTPLAQDLGAVAPQLGDAISTTTSFARDAGPALRQTRPLLRTAASTLGGGRRSLQRLVGALDATLSAAPSIRSYTDLMTPLIRYFIKGSLISLGQIAGEPGARTPGSTQISDEPHRNFFRVLAVLGCESFGYTVHPGCMADAVNAAAGNGAQAKPDARRHAPARRPSLPSVHTPELPATPPSLPPVVSTAVDQVKGAIEHLTGGPGDKNNGLLDFLLGK